MAAAGPGAPAGASALVDQGEAAFDDGGEHVASRGAGELGGQGLCVLRQGRVPVVAIGNGFCLPPAEMETFPALLPKVKPLIRQEDMLATINAVQRDRGAPSLPRLPALFEADAQFVYTFPILDPYAAFRARPADGPLESLPGPAPPPAEDHVFVYYGTELPSVKPLMEGLAGAGLPATVQSSP